MTTTQQTKLPPLPEAMHCDIQLGVHSGQLAYYSQVQILAYGQLCREQALEDAAKSIDDIDDGEASAYRHCQEHIRSMK